MRKTLFSSLFTLLCIPAVCAAQPTTAEVPMPTTVPTVMTTQVMQARIDKLNLELQALGAYLTVGADGRLGCACGGVPTVPNAGGGRGPRSPLDTQHLIQALQAMQLVLNNERAGKGTVIYSTLAPKAGGAVALPN